MHVTQDTVFFSGNCLVVTLRFKEGADNLVVCPKKNFLSQWFYQLDEGNRECNVRGR